MIALISLGVNLSLPVTPAMTGMLIHFGMEAALVINGRNPAGLRLPAGRRYVKNAVIRVPRNDPPALTFPGSPGEVRTGLCDQHDVLLSPLLQSPPPPPQS